MKLKVAAGFTLIEVMVALAILAGLSLLTAQAIKSAIDNRSSLTAELARDSAVADTLRVIRNDIANAFHYRDIDYEMQAALCAAPTPGTNAPPPGCTPPPPRKEVTAFVGEADKLYFTAVSNVRTLRDSQVSDQIKIGYYLESCKSRKPKGQSSECLLRATSPHLDDDVTKIEDGTVLAENVEEFKLRYLGPEREEYVDTWKTGKDGDAISKDQFPYAVEITLTIHDKSDKREKPVTQTILAPLQFPNNKPKPSGSPLQR